MQSDQYAEEPVALTEEEDDCHFEVEHKLLIHFPPASLLEQPGCVVWQIAQTYLISDKSVTARVRHIDCNGEDRYIYTEKQRISALKCIEKEQEIEKSLYEALLKRKRPGTRTIEKTRYRLPWQGHTLEFDIYPFWTDRAILEIELADENETFSLPQAVRVIREVTGDVRYKNAMLAYEIVAEPIGENI